MKNSEILLLEARSEDNDLRALGKYTKALKEGRMEKFENEWLPRLNEVANVEFRSNGSYTIESKFGLLDFYPKANKVLIRKSNEWKKPGLSFIIKNILY